MLSAGDLIAKRYRLIQELGRGGIGVVWEAEDQRLDRQVALKVIVPKLARDPKKLERFEVNAKAVARLRSPHIVQLLDYGVDKVPFMVMELLHGTVLRERFEQGQRFEPEAATGIVVQTAKALAAAHEQGVVHRALRPSNIFLIHDHGDHFVKVFDFGTAKWVTGFRDANDITTMGAIMVTPDYLAPEQLSGDERSDHRADLWALAAIAYHCFTGIKPFEGEQMGELMRSILFAEPVAPSSINGNLPHELDIFFRRALNRNRDERFQSARELAEALCHVIGVTGSFGITALRTGQPQDPPEFSMGDDFAERDLIATRDEKSQPTASSPHISTSFIDEGSSLDARPSGLDTTTRSALVRPVAGGRGFSFGPLVRNVPLGMLIAGAALALLLGGAAAWMLFRQPRGNVSAGTIAPSAEVSARSEDDVDPDGSATRPVSSSPDPAASPSSNGAAPHASATAPRVFTPRPRDTDIYED